MFLCYLQINIKKRARRGAAIQAMIGLTDPEEIPTQMYDYTYEDIFRASLSPMQENIVHFKIGFKHTFELKHFPFSFLKVRFRVGVRV